MGIHNLHKCHLFDKENYEVTYLQNTFLVIDWANISARLYDGVANSSAKLGGNYDIFGWNTKLFFSTLKSCKITPILVLDGLQSYLNYWVNHPTRNRKSYGKNRNCLPLLTPHIGYNIARKLGIQVIRPLAPADDTVAALATAYDCPVLSGDYDFYFYGVKFIPYSSVHKQPIPGDGGPSILCELYNPCTLFNELSEFKPSFLPLALELLDTKNMNSALWKNFYYEVSENQSILSILNWLSQFKSLENAVAAIVKHISVEKREKVADYLEKRIWEFGTISSDILPYLPLDTTKVDYLKKRRQEQRLQFRRYLDVTRKRDSLRGEDDAEIDKSDKSNECDLITGEMIIAEAPDWWCRNFITTGSPIGIVDKLLMYYIRMIKFEKNESFHPAHEGELPMLIRISELIISTMEDREYVLNVPITDRDCEVRSITLKKWPVNLDQLRSDAAAMRIRLINETFGIRNHENLHKLPETWRLYVVTITYWMKRKCEIVQTDAHLCSLLFTMLLGLIDDKIGFFRRTDDSKVYECDKYQVDESNEYDTLNVSEDDCSAAANFFQSHSMMGDEEFEHVKSNNDSENFEQNFWEFQKCFQYTHQFNALLDYPYTPSPLHKFYNATLLYHVFTKFLKAEDIDESVMEILEKSPGLISVFEMLKDVVLHELNESIT
ncbi:uncharacterized protein LOC135166374 [Diachasmimorpha longicaudata]|uniref:uncharacterized protein LOC135166374 n=1 Tax=Diachasmimorpha longicaudata TaxID=58733 RepID=UPI0030B90A9B